MTLEGTGALRLVGEGEGLGLEGMLHTSRYRPDKILGKGTWGVVLGAKDMATGERVALKILQPTPEAKRQMEERGWTPFGAMRNEGDLAPCARIVPRAFEVDERGAPFIRMPEYHWFLSQDIVDDPKARTSYGRGISRERAVGYLSDISGGLAEMHGILERPHLDLKPDNLAVKDGRVLINDLGSATCKRLNWVQGPVGEGDRGFVGTRSPDAYKSKVSDVWSFGALAYRILSKGGEYPLEGRDPAQVLKGLGEKKMRRQLRRSIRKNIPLAWQGLLSRCLEPDYYKREKKIPDGVALEREVDRTIKRMTVPGEVLYGLKRWGIATTVAGLSIAGVYAGATYDPSDLSMPRARTQGLLYLQNPPGSEDVVFESEHLEDLPKAYEGNLINGVSAWAKRATDNRNVAYLLKAHNQTMLGSRGNVSKFQQALYARERSAEGMWVASADPGPAYMAPAKAIEFAMAHAKTENGTLDLEDVCAIARVGTAPVMEAKRISRSEDYGTYRDAKNPQGEYIIPRGERRFIDRWLSQIHADV